MALILAALVLGAPENGLAVSPAPVVEKEADELYDNTKYAYDYTVRDDHTGDYKSHVETRQGDVVRGEYSLVEPDGSVRIVEYTADKRNGFNAIVKKKVPSVPKKVVPTIPVVQQQQTKAPVPLYSQSGLQTAFLPLGGAIGPSYRGNFQHIFTGYSPFINT